MTDGDCAAPLSREAMMQADIVERLRKAAMEFEAQRQYSANAEDSDCEPHWSDQPAMAEASASALEAAALIETLRSERDAIRAETVEAKDKAYASTSVGPVLWSELWQDEVDLREGSRRAIKEAAYISDLATTWATARTSVVNLSISAPDYREKLNEMSEAEDGLAAAIRAMGKEVKP